MAYVFETSVLGLPSIASTVLPATLTGPQPAGRSSPSRLGSIERAYDPVYGMGEFIYLLGVAATVVGSVVTWGGNAAGTPTYQTALNGVTPVKGQPLAVAMSANVAGSYGWYQISGQAVVATSGTFTANAQLFSAAAGALTTAVATGLQVVNALSMTATGTPSAGLGVIEINRPFAQGQIT